MTRRKVATRRLTSAKARAAELERSAQRAYRDRLKKRQREVRAAIAAIRRAEKLALVQVKHSCRNSRARARARIRARRAEVLARLREESAQLLGEARRACEARASKVGRRSAKARAGLEREAKALARELASDKLFREFHSGRRPSSRASSVEIRSESDDEVRRNLEADLVPVFDAVRGSIHGTPKKSRTETFLQWAEENPDDVLTIRSELGDRAFARELREHQAHERRIARLLKRKGRIRPSELEAVGISPEEVAAAGLDPADPEEVQLFLQGPDAVDVEAETVPF